jgi:hypothetical protein
VDCENVRELLDAYALGATDEAENKAVEEHIAECVRCWDELATAQRAAALIPLTMPMQEPPARLRERIVTTAQRETSPRPSLNLIIGGKSLAWPAAAGAFATAAAAVLVFAVFLQVQVDDLQGDRNQLEARVEDQGDILGVATASDVQTVSMVAPAPAAPAEPQTTGEDEPGGEYLWSRSQDKGVIICHDLPRLDEGWVYQAWYVTDTEPVDAGTFTVDDGSCQHLMEPLIADIPTTGVGLSREKGAGSARPSGRWLIFASFGD